jgi:pimeloyl-ACP methyl ester carboxylesterase
MYGTSSIPGASPEEFTGAVVVLVHGLWTGGWSWLLLRARLQRGGFGCAVFSYRSVSQSLQANAHALTRFVSAIDAPAVHFVGHSLGGALIYRALVDHPEPRPGRVVLLATPILGSRVGRRLEASAPGRVLLGKTVVEWLASAPASWDQPQQLGVIAGSVALGLGRLVTTKPALPNDGTVAVSETQVPGATDHIVLPVSHSGMLIAPTVARQVVNFLRHGRFQEADVTADFRR